jgi:hypothetical protein
MIFPFRHEIKAESLLSYRLYEAQAANQQPHVGCYICTFTSLPWHWQII